MDKTLHYWQMHLQYSAHIFKRVFLDKVYKLKFQSGLRVTIEASDKTFPHLVGINKTIVASYGGGSKIFKAIYSGRDFVFSTNIKFPLRTRSLEGQKIYTLNKFDIFFENIPKIMAIQFDKSKSTNLCKLIFNTHYLLIKSEYNFALGLVEKSIGSKTYVPNSIMNISNSIDKYFDYQQIEFLDEIEVFNSLNLTTTIISIKYLPNELWVISGLLLRNNCTFSANLELTTKINNLIQERKLKSNYA